MLGNAGVSLAVFVPLGPPLAGPLAFGRVELALQYLSIASDSTVLHGLVPGTFPEAIHLTNLLGNTPNAGIVVADSVIHPQFGTFLGLPAPYWLVLSVPDRANIFFDWKLASLSGPLLMPLSTRLDSLRWFNAAPALAFAFRVSTAGMPEPASLLGLALLWIRREVVTLRYRSSSAWRPPRIR